LCCLEFHKHRQASSCLAVLQMAWAQLPGGSFFLKWMHPISRSCFLYHAPAELTALSWPTLRSVFHSCWAPVLRQPSSLSPGRHSRSSLLT
jgi:hypothetical protein